MANSLVFSVKCSITDSVSRKRNFKAPFFVHATFLTDFCNWLNTDVTHWEPCYPWNHSPTYECMVWS